MISANEGWLLLDQRLFWTRDSGQSWTDITPANRGQAVIQAVWFEDSQSGRLVLTQVDPTGAIRYSLARTTDGGNTWQISPLALFEPGDPAALAGAIYLHFIDVQTGWLVVKQATSRNFSLGALFKTRDGGQTWTRLSLPVGEPVYFVTPELGWTAGGPADDHLYHTRDGGQTWQAQSLGQNLLYRLPTFIDNQNGVLPVIMADSANARAEFYITDDGGESWNRLNTVSLGQEVTSGTIVPLAVLDTRRWLMIAPGSRRLESFSAGRSDPTIVSQNEWVKGIGELNMATHDSGWARYGAGSCVTKPDQQPPSVMRCTQETRLLRTGDGGRTWTPLNLPGIASARVEKNRLLAESVIPSSPLSTQELGSQTGVLVGQGFDKCEIASLSQLETWLTNSPYRAVNLYIGGSSRYCANAALSASLLAELNRQGWYFIPTWVGPQAPCTTYTSRISYDLATAYNQGLAEASAALDVAHTLGLTLEDKSGTIIYYDLEYFDTSNMACYDATKAFVAGWTGQLRGQNNHAGVYSNGFILNGFASLPNVPDAIWPAHWLQPYAYNPDASVWDVYGLSNSLWNQQQRLRQYNGGHNESWGGVTLNIDSDVIEGVVALLHREKSYLPLIEREAADSPPAE